MKKTHISADTLLIGALLLGGVIVLVVLFATGRAGERVQVRIDGTVTADYPLNRDQSVLIEGFDGGTNLLIIEDGTARIEEADCPDALCVRTGRISRQGQSIVCLPHKVVVEIVGGDADDPGVDAVTGGRQ